MTIDLQVLKNEIEINPVSLPYPAFTAENDSVIADILNNTNGNNPRTVDNDTINTYDVVAATTYEAFDGLTASEESYLKWLTSIDLVAVTADTKLNLAGIGGTSKWAVGERALMDARITALMQRIGSRAEELKDTLGQSYVTPSDVANARNLP